MGCVNDKQDRWQSYSNDLKAPKSHVTYWAEVVETDIFTAWLFYITTKQDFLTLRHVTCKILPKSRLLIVINSIADSGDNNDSEQKNRCYPDLPNKSGVLCDFFEKFLYNMPSHLISIENFVFWGRLLNLTGGNVIKSYMLYRWLMPTPTWCWFHFLSIENYQFW